MKYRAKANLGTKSGKVYRKDDVLTESDYKLLSATQKEKCSEIKPIVEVKLDEDK
jgi:hypothetical protein